MREPTDEDLFRRSRTAAPDSLPRWLASIEFFEWSALFGTVAAILALVWIASWTLRVLLRAW